ncbi:MAG: 16S rRNA (guanine(527)-N(7))-methyltransferase RsmG [Bacteroidetes bacterium]|nr:16S rRNA (guanine(527)-N(7))-methyltransferase RsmG [Bacteroidota bacterium]MSP57847.1 16S rRNA (guanine(527)-N(7))-methyltransferase RsmG [Flavobacteriaceae bacterium]PHX91901.1 MAG: 16S rRNA (guanine(527)-N(7))-methyltransferase RsmG [Flavobacteriales bacterium]
MVGSEIILDYFPGLSKTQQNQIVQLGGLYHFHNQRVNVISRKDMDMFYIHHVLHSLALAKTCAFANGSNFIDIGTGGGFPGIPLSILFPEVRFTLVDSIGKKIAVVQDVIDSLKLGNAKAILYRAEHLNSTYDGAIARAVAPAIELFNWMNGHWNAEPLFYLLKGGDLGTELNEVLQVSPKIKMKIQSISEIFPAQAFFETKKVVQLFH